jgi:predicted nucleotidyltransferase|tara:strand:+ start:62 stop:442 length:381 start_codon:yes stop_codon:yes gene_type:complete
MRLSPSQSTSCLRALELFSPAVIYVFGSYGTKTQHGGSDLDIAFLAILPSEPFQLFKIANNLSHEIGIDVDLIDLSRASTVLRKEVIRTGEPIYIDNETAMRQFEMLTLSDYARLNEERHEILTTH